MGQVLTKNEGFSDFCEGWVPFLLEIKQKAGWLVGSYAGKKECIYIATPALFPPSLLVGGRPGPFPRLAAPPLIIRLVNSIGRHCMMHNVGADAYHTPSSLNIV